MASKDDIVHVMGLSAPETMPEAALAQEGVRGVDVDVELPGADELEAGVAAVFEAIRSGEDASGAAPEADMADAETDDGPLEDSGVTFALLTELNRLWERPPV